MTATLERLSAALADRYRIERELGAGGMATVYLAEDLKHGRRVAIKVLRPELAAVIGAERFVREIRTIAALQHPHILGLIDSGEVQGTAYYVMPYVEGESLRDRLNREKQITINESVRIASEVASALDYAHRHGVIHRDVKPENILLHDGQALVADFGIALAASSAGGSRMTETGMSLGTPHYMSPEQAMGEREITARSDIYALGCVTYEMLVGEPPFTGPTAQAIVAKMMTEDPRSLVVQRKTIPAEVEDAVLVALSKLPADRFGSAADFSEALKGGSTSRTVPRPRQVARQGSHRGWVPLAAVALPLAVLAAWGWLRPAGSGENASSRSVDVVLPDSAPVEFIGEATIGVGQTAIALSPDGRTLAYVAGGVSRPRIFIRPLDRYEATPLAGTEGAFHPFFSPDGAWIGFFADNQLRKVATAGGPVTTLAEASQTTGGVWTRTGDILFTTDLSALTRVSASGGQPVNLRTGSNTGVGCTKTITLLPDDRWVLCTSFSDQAYSFLLAYSLDTGESRVLVRSGQAKPWRSGQPIPDDVLLGTTPVYRRDGHLLYTRPDGTLVLIRFDPDRMVTSGEPRLIATGVRHESWSHQAQVAAADDGTIVYIPGSDAHLGVLAWLDRGGRVDTLPFPAANSMGTDVSPDGSAATVIIPAVSGHLELWLYDLASGDRRRMLSSLGVSESRWTADGKYVIAGLADGSLVRVDPFRPGRLDTLAKAGIYPFALSRDGRFLIGSAGQNPVTGEDLLTTYRVALNGGSPERLNYGGQAGGAFGHTFSPDNRWLAYLGRGGGVFVEPYPPTGEMYRVSGQLSGDVPYWSAAGDEIFFPSNSQLYVTRVHPGMPPRFDPPRLIASQRFANYSGRPYAVAPDGQRFLIKLSSPEHSARSIRVILGSSISAGGSR